MAKKARSMSSLATLDNADNTAAQLEQRRRLAALKPAGIRQIPIKSIRIDRSFNVREDSSYEKATNLELYNSLKEFGIDQTKPYMAFSEFSESTDTQKMAYEFRSPANLGFEPLEGSVSEVPQTTDSPKPRTAYLTLRGNVRMTLIFLINEEEQNAGRPAPFTTVPGLVYQGLSKVEEILIMADHTGSRELNKYEQTGMIGKAREARGLTYEQASAYFGVNANTIQRACMTWEMPPVYENLRKQVHDDPDALPIGQTELTRLFKGYRADLAANGLPRDCSGPAFTEAWNLMHEIWRQKEEGEPIRKGKTGQEIAQTRSSVGAITGPAGELASAVLGWTLGEPMSISKKVQDFTDSITANEKRLLLRIEELESTNRELNEMLEAYVNKFGSIELEEVKA